MHYEAYILTNNHENTRFQFQSIGKRGVFEKVIFIKLSKKKPTLDY